MRQLFAALTVLAVFTATSAQARTHYNGVDRHDVRGYTPTLEYAPAARQRYAKKHRRRVRHHHHRRVHRHQKPSAVAARLSPPISFTNEANTAKLFKAFGKELNISLSGVFETTAVPSSIPSAAACNRPASPLTAMRTRSGRCYNVLSAVANRFARFIAWLEGTGYRIQFIGGYSHRHIAGTGRWSNHARGTAIDINQTARNVVTRRFPPGTTAKAQELGLLHGAVWRHPDTGHFELMSSRQFAVLGGGHARTTRVAYHHHRKRHRYRRYARI